MCITLFGRCAVICPEGADALEITHSGIKLTGVIEFFERVGKQASDKKTSIAPSGKELIAETNHSSCAREEEKLNNRWLRFACKSLH